MCIKFIFWEDMVLTSSTVRVSHVGLNVTDQAVEDLFADYGPIKRCFVVNPKKAKNNNNKGSNKTIAYVEFALPEDAAKAISEITLKSPELGISGTPITVSSAPDRSQDASNNTGKENESTSNEEGINRKNILANREAAKQKKARLIVRNIPWKSTESTLKEHFESPRGGGGKVVEVNILKKKDGKMVGCAFVQLSNVAEAATAIKQLNGKLFLNRPIAVDWAVSKEEFKKGNADKSISNDTKPDNEDMGAKDKITEVDDDGEEREEEEDSCDDDNEEEEVDSDSEAKGVDGNESDNSTHSADEPIAKTKNNWPQTGHDINEKKTVFVRNISFDSDQDDLRDMMEDNFGKVLFARFVIDKTTEHPKVGIFPLFST